MQKIIDILQSIKPHLNFENETHIFDDGLLDSFDILILIGELNDNFNISISVEDIDAKNFNSVSAMHELVKTLQ